MSALSIGLCTSVAVSLVVSAATFRLMRSYALAVERSAAALTDKVHRLQRSMTVGVLVGCVVGLASWAIPFSVAISHTHRVAARQHDDSLLKVLLVLVVTPLVVVLVLLPAIALARAVRPSYARLRKVPMKQPERWRSALVCGLSTAVVITLIDVLRAVAPKAGAAHVAVLVGGYAVGLLALQTLMAPLMVKLLRAKPLPPDAAPRLQSLASRMDVRVRAIRTYPRRAQRQANAVQIGLLPQLRYVLISDYLLENLTPEQADAVIAHELGHARGRHLLIKLGSVGLVWILLEGILALTTYLTQDHHVSSGIWTAPLIIAVPVGFVIVQGLVGIRLEERADDAAARVIGAAAMVGALDKLAELNDAKRDTGRGWALLTQHPGIDVRVKRLRQQHPEAYVQV